MAEASRELRARLGSGSFVVVADRGMVSANNVRALRDEGIEYVIAERLRRWKADEALARAGTYKKVTPTIEVKEVTTDGRERLLVCRNTERGADDARQRQAIIEHLEAKLEAGGLRAHLKPAARRYLTTTGERTEIDFNKVKADARVDGK